MTYRLMIIESGSGDEYDVGLFPSLAACSAALGELEDRFDKWCRDGNPPLECDDLLNHYEGCDAEAEGSDGEVYHEVGTGLWERE